MGCVPLFSAATSSGNWCLCAGCRWLTADALPQSGDAFQAALSGLPIERASFAGCELLEGIGWLLASNGWRLKHLDLSRTAVGDGDVELIAEGCSELRSLDLSGCCRIKGPGLQAVFQAALLGNLRELRLADLAWVQPEHLADLLRSWSRAAECGISVDLSGCGGLNDSSLRALWPVPATSGRYCIEQLQLGGSGKVSASALQQLAPVASLQMSDILPLLHRLQHLDVSHVQSLSKGGAGPSSAAASAGDSPAAEALSALFRTAGGSLRTAILDGCFMGASLLPLLVGFCPGVERLSLVGCSGLADADLATLTGLRSLSDLAVGGSSLAWHEHRSLSGLNGLTRLRLARRPYLTDAQLAPLLAANRGSLRQLELAGCASLTDAALLHLLPPYQLGSGASGGSGEARHSSRQPHQQRQQAPPLERLHLVCCDRITGTSLRHLRRLRSLRLSGCPAVSETALQAAAICCTRLTLLELPSHIPANRMPVAPAGAASHLHGLQLLGGLQEGGRWGTRGRRRDGSSTS
ncbi:F-box LRR-repeat 2 isoform X1 [Chlorella sorokiniana]|uniref:F-box LRR-repeat 2 isoform X1 n=1 Tax=Chlorella sorokiniana TaxID=3076 RepID=A0A2P6THN3_CHLSO|nr:F-box LRR-repeat 2 isoform X1 [Chlorella sorokiniana]|eukprot:PRW33789.1 F-box LRR-repeat 2 isoform X1 [Chlorella sorokiniana]